jgi:hypothetical protein
MQNVNPILQQALAAFSPPSPLAEYHKALQSFDWQYAFSDDYLVFARGVNALEKLHAIQTKVDPTGEIWNSYPGSKGHGAPFPRITEAA